MYDGKTLTKLKKLSELAPWPASSICGTKLTEYTKTEPILLSRRTSCPPGRITGTLDAYPLMINVKRKYGIRDSSSLRLT
jgi:hypothetical protein